MQSAKKIQVVDEVGGFEDFLSFYREVFPESEIPVETLQRYYALGARVDLKEGALFLPKYEDQWHLEHAPEEVWEMPMIYDELDEVRETASVGELLDAGINFNMGDEDRQFIIDKVEWMGLEGYVVSEQPGELRGILTRDSKESSMLEPLTFEEARQFLIAVHGGEQYLSGDPDFSDAAKERAEHYIDTIGDTENKKSCIDMLESAIDIMDYDMSAEVRRELYITFGGEFLARVKVSTSRMNIGDNWSHVGRFFIGEREGITHDQAVQNDETFSKQMQWQQPDERCDGQLMEFQEEEYARLYLENFDDLFNAETRGPDGGPGNRMFSEYRRYLRRCAEGRNERARKALWHIMTWPLEMVPQLFSHFEKSYKESIKENSPGPASKKVNNIWCKVPLEGKKAVNEIRRRGAGSLKGRKISNSIKFHKGESWHKTFLSREQMELLTEAKERRLGRINLVINGEKSVEQIATYQGLSLQDIKAQKSYEYSEGEKAEFNAWRLM